jgi:hypothetical protein
MLAFFSVVAGIGNGVFHPVDYTLLNRKIHPKRLGHAFSVHGITGSLGWALAPAMMVSITPASSWRVALASAGVLALVVMGVFWLNRAQLTIEMTSCQARGRPLHADPRRQLRFPCDSRGLGRFAFFFLYAIVISGIQAFAPAARQLHAGPPPGGDVSPSTWSPAPAACVMAVDATRSGDRGIGFGIAAAGPDHRPCAAGIDGSAGALRLHGRAAGIAGPRDLIVKRAAPPNATGRVYGVVYSGLDIGQAAAPLMFGPLSTCTVRPTSGSASPSFRAC